MQKKDVKFLKYISGIFVGKYVPSTGIDFVPFVLLYFDGFHIPLKNKKTALY